MESRSVTFRKTR